MNLHLSASTSCVLGPEPRTSTAKPTASTAECGSGRHSASSPVSRNNGERFLAPGYACVPRADWLRRYHETVLPKGAHFWYKGDDGLCWLGKISASTTEDKVYLVRFLDNPRPIKRPLPPARYMTSTGAVRGSWCLQAHIASAFPRGIQRNVDESRGEAVAS